MKTQSLPYSRAKSKHKQKRYKNFMIVIEARLVEAAQQKKEINADLVGKRIRFQQVKKEKLKTLPGEGHKRSVEVIV